MGNTNRRGTVVVGERDHDEFEVDGQRYLIRELVWNGTDGRSYDVVRAADDAVLTEGESFDRYPTDEQIAEILDSHGVDAEVGTCKFCDGQVLLATAHRHGGGWVGDTCCWDERLRAT